MTDFEKTRSFFDLPEGITYLDGNSLGPLPKGVPARLEALLRNDWGSKLITGWIHSGWMDLPIRLGDRIAGLIGAAPGSVVTGDTLSVKVYQALASALELRPDRKVILSDSGNFPSDLYMADGLIRSLEQGHELRIVEPEQVAEAIGPDVAVLMLTEVDYRTGRRHDVSSLTARAHESGALTIWDLAHSAGALPVDLSASEADFAVGCTYKYLNGGPGAPAFIHVRPDLADRVRPALSGWLGHAAPFDFDLAYRPGAGIERMRCGTPPILQMTALDVALDVWKMADIEDVRARSMDLSERFIAAVEAHCPGVVLNSPRDPKRRGSQVSFRHPQGYAIMQALIAHGVIGDFRAPDNLRFGITPLYIGPDDIDRAVDVLATILRGELWNRPEFRRRKAVT